NCFTGIEDFARAQRLADRQVRIDWEAELDRLLRRGPPPPRVWLPADHRSSAAAQTAGATAPAVRRAAAPARPLPRPNPPAGGDVRGSRGRQRPAAGRAPPRYQDEVTSDLKRRPEGVRIKHRAGRNAVKLSDKPGSVLRVETTLNEVKGLKSYRAAADDPGGP